MRSPTICRRKQEPIWTRCSRILRRVSLPGKSCPLAESMGTEIIYRRTERLIRLLVAERTKLSASRVIGVALNSILAAYDFPSPSLCSDHPRNPDTYIAERWHGCSHSLAKSSVSQWDSPARRVLRFSASGAIHKSACLLARVGDPIVGVILSLEMFRRLGSGLLLFSGRLFLGRRGRSSSQTNMANAWSGRKRYRCADVRALGEFLVCHRDSVSSARRPKG